MTWYSQVALDAYNAARAAYLDAHPEPRDVDFPCRRCRATPGQPCTWRRNPNHHVPTFPKGAHNERYKLAAKARSARIDAAISAGDAAYSGAYQEDM
ncbi:hypothetical protein ABZ912_42580 [Nonomuraea angiospora]|uniref:zinc finger domain-containing protein n=1 Tax=Nonomuraea angiospora TaxID=46172 RepID=UPI0033F94BD3